MSRIYVDVRSRTVSDTPPKMKVYELQGAALDWAVAKCEGKNGVLHDDGITRCIVTASPSGVYKGTYQPSINWNLAGPIIEREEISVNWANGQWQAHTVNEQDEYEQIEYGPTPLIAAMRVFVASKLGDEIEVPNELIGE